ncbi:MAG: hypothetical protein MI725_09905 [Pirellulales bacterium]|nr:hypothetical protein [Pirellulales bacterium]
MIQKNSSDPIVDEIHQTRREIAEKFGNDIAAIAEDARRRQAQSGRVVWQAKSSSKIVPPSDKSISGSGESTSAVN